MVQDYLSGWFNVFIIIDESIKSSIDQVILPELCFPFKSTDFVDEQKNVPVISLETCIQFVEFGKYICEVCYKTHLLIVRQELTKSFFPTSIA